MVKSIADIDCAWIAKATKDDDVVVSTRVRLARNLQGIPFPNQARSEQAETVIMAVLRALERLNDSFVFRKVADLAPIERQVLVEKHFMSPQHAKKKHGAAIAVNERGDLSCMINEEDHLRLQCLLPGLRLVEAWNMVDKLDDSLEQQLDYAFDEDIGYLTACPTNVGTGLRASIMLHLPALVYTKQIAGALSAISQLGLVVRGLYGEGTEALGNMFQLSNQITLGLSEEEIIENVTNVAVQLVEQERRARHYLMQHHRIEVEDRVGRAYGILRGARKISSQEAMKLLSEVRLGIGLGIIKGCSPKTCNELLVGVQVGYLQHLAGEELSTERRDIIRATVIREKLNMDS